MTYVHPDRIRLARVLHARLHNDSACSFTNADKGDCPTYIHAVQSVELIGEEVAEIRTEAFRYGQERGNENSDMWRNMYLTATGIPVSEHQAKRIEEFARNAENALGEALSYRRELDTLKDRIQSLSETLEAAEIADLTDHHSTEVAALLEEPDDWKHTPPVTKTVTHRVTRINEALTNLLADVEHHRITTDEDPSLLCRDGYWADLQPRIQEIITTLKELP